jgi:hypothetical protein
MVDVVQGSSHGMQCSLQDYGWQTWQTMCKVNMLLQLTLWFI